MPIRIAPDRNLPSVAIEIPLEQPLPDYGLEDIQQPTPRDVDALLASRGFRDLVDDARGVLTELVANRLPLHHSSHFLELDLEQAPQFEITQLTGAICPSDDDVYRPGLWIVLRDPKATQTSPLNEPSLEYVRAIARELGKRLGVI